jgi:hypothetical protein
MRNSLGTKIVDFDEIGNTFLCYQTNYKVYQLSNCSFAQKISKVASMKWFDLTQELLDNIPTDGFLVHISGGCRQTLINWMQAFSLNDRKHL